MSNSGLTVIKKFYDRWNIQGFVLLSLLIQTILILFAPFRKRTGNVIVVLLSVLAYLVADWAVNVAVGLISFSQKEIHDYHDSHKFLDDDHHVDILAFWAPFLLLHHLPEQDNAGLWQRQFIGLLSRVFNAITIFSQSLPRNKLSVPIVLLFVAGTIKYGERTYALFRANPNKLRESMLGVHPDPGPNYAKIMEEYGSKKEAKLPTHIELIVEPNKESKTARYAAFDEGKLNDIQQVQHAYRLFQVFKGLVVELIFSFRDRDDSRRFFHQRSPEEAFKVIAIELNFMYEVFYTKVVVARLMFGHVVVRFISWCAVVAALSIFYTIDKHGFRKIDVEITYTLFFGAIGLDTIALFLLAFSDWTAASIQQLSGNIIVKGMNRCFLPLLKYFLTLKRINWGSADTESTSCLGRAKQCLKLLIHPKKCLNQARQILFRRWSESLYQYNLIDYCLEENRQNNSFGRVWIKFIDKWLDLKDLYDQMNYIYKKPLLRGLWDFIFKELKKKSDLVDDPDIVKKICSVRGDWVLQNTDWIIDNSKLMHYIVDIDYDQSLILWHIATDLCYSMDTNNNEDCFREFSKSLSDYMLYLLVMQPTMMSVVSGIGQIRFRDTCAEAKIFFKRKGLGQVQKEEHIRACAMILEVNTDVEPIAVKGDRCKSVLFDACILAKELSKFESHKRWKLMSEVWVELLSYAASHCRANTHVAQLSKGGELITFVWLLVAHFGIGDQFQINKGIPRAKLIVGK